MFFPPKLTTILFSSLIAVTMLTGSADGQQADFERRMAAMQEARMRAQMPASESLRVASSDMGVDYADPPPPAARVARAPQRVLLGQSSDRQAPLANAIHQVRTRQPVRRAIGASAQNYVPTHMQAAPLSGETFIDGGSPIVSGQMVGTQMGTSYGVPMETSYGTPIGTGAVGCTSCGDSYGGEVVGGGCSSCDSCGDTGGYFEDQCCGRGGCPPQDCWLTGLGAVLYRGEYFGGATSFRSALFATPGGNVGDLSNDCSHGFYGGFNFGLPLCKLSCGLFSGQVGVRSVQTNFNGAAFTPDNRDQLFVTAGIFRRVDYGLQAGVVADILRETWFTEVDLVQVRGELSWVYAGGANIGFRFATNTQDDVSDGTFDGNAFTGLTTSTDDNYRIFYRYEGAGQGYGEVFAGWSETDQTIVGLEFDRAIGERIAVQAGFTYYLNDDPAPANSNILGGNPGEAYNIFVGFSMRPRGSAHYRSYDRPLFSVADNGSMLMTRN